MLTRVTLWFGAVVVGVGLVWFSNSYLLRQEPQTDDSRVNLDDVDLTPEAASSRPFSEFVSNELPRTRVEVAREKALAEVSAQIDEMRTSLTAKSEPKEKAEEEKPAVVVADPVPNNEPEDESYSGGSMLFASAVLPRVNAASGGSQSGSGLTAHRSAPASAGGSGGGGSGGASGGASGTTGSASSNPADGGGAGETGEQEENDGPPEEVADNETEGENQEDNSATENSEQDEEENNGEEVVGSEQDSDDEQQSQSGEEQQDDQPENELLALNEEGPKDEEPKQEQDQSEQQGGSDDENVGGNENEGGEQEETASDDDTPAPEEETLAKTEDPEEEAPASQDQGEGDDEQPPPAGTPVEEDIEQLVGDILDEGFTEPEPEEGETSEEDPFEEPAPQVQQPNVVAVSEPGSIMLFLLGLVGVMFSRRRMK